MPTFQREDLSAQHFILKVTITPADYEAEFDTELAKYRKQAALKGFRKGKTPAAVLRKMFGKSVLADILNKKIQQSVDQYIKEQDINMLGGPIATDDNESLDINTSQLQDYSFSFEIGYAPDFDIIGAGPESEYQRYAVVVSDEMLSEQVSYLRDALSKATDINSGFTEKDLLELTVVELDGDDAHAEPVEAKFSVKINEVKDEALRAALLSAAVGDTHRINVFEAFDADEDTIRNRWLKLNDQPRQDPGQWFKATITAATRFEPAELNEDFYNQAFGDDIVHNETEMYDFLRNSMEKQYLDPANTMMYVEMRKRITEQTQISLPEDFLKKWLAYNNEDVSPEAIDEGFNAFTENLRWTLVRSKLTRDLNVTVTEQDLLDYFKQRVRGYFGGNSPYITEDFLNDMARRMMENQESSRDAYEEILTEKVFRKAGEQVSISSVPIAKDEFNQKFEELRNSVNPENQAEPDNDSE
jgi:trigger factor